VEPRTARAGEVIDSLAARYRGIVARVAEAAIRAGREPQEITIVVAAKTFPADVVRQVAEAGARDFGENYVQEAQGKASILGTPGVRWHMIGRLQRNKAAPAVRLFHLIHSLDRIDLARALDRAATKAAKRVRCLVEVDLGGEVTKGGVAVDALPGLLEEVAKLQSLEVHGLMAIPPMGSLVERRRHFARLRDLRERLSRLRLSNVRLKELSMGMSGDFEAAVEEGATMVRIGTAIFGPRP
jgi:pyridoxal phosphate enzyme (YggS family)